jgi:NAD(P)-dependent dehydrogenase (short-subunit alcohol dehydrogenase family)
MSLNNQLVLITGAAVRIGRSLALSIARAGADVVIHYGSSVMEAENLKREIENLGRKAFLLQADLNDVNQVSEIIPRALVHGRLSGLVNNAAIFEPVDWSGTSYAIWSRHIQVNLTAPFFISQAFARSLSDEQSGRIVNILDWRATRPGPDHFPYTISKAGLAAMTLSLAQALAPRITVNGLALGAILPPSDGGETDSIIDRVPAGRWADLDEVSQALLFLLEGPTYITGEILHIDGGRHAVP